MRLPSDRPAGSMLPALATFHSRFNTPFGRRLSLYFLLAALLLPAAGCARYKVTFANQSVTTSRGKPKHDKENGTIVFKDATGKKQVIPAFTIQTIEPY